MDYAKGGCRQVAVIGKDDKHEITVLFAVTASGTLLPLQAVYQDKTVDCHLQIIFQAKWNITHSDNHWSNETTMIENLQEIIIPFVTETRKELDLADNHPASF